MVPLILALAAFGLLLTTLCYLIVADMERLELQIETLTKQQGRLTAQQQSGATELAETSRQLAAVDLAMAEVAAQSALLINSGRFHQLVCEDLGEVRRDRRS